MNEEEITNQYEKGIVELSSITEPLIETFKNDKASLDIQQLQLLTHYLILEREFNENYIDELEKEKEKNKELRKELNKEKEKNKMLDSKIFIKGDYEGTIGNLIEMITPTPKKSCSC